MDYYSSHGTVQRLTLQLCCVFFFTPHYEGAGEGGILESFCPPVFLSVCLPVCLPVRLSPRLSPCLSVTLLVWTQVLKHAEARVCELGVNVRADVPSDRSTQIPSFPTNLSRSIRPQNQSVYWRSNQTAISQSQGLGVR